MTTELVSEFARIVAENTLTNLGQYKRWAAKNRDLADKFIECRKQYYEEASFFEFSDKRGRSANHMPKEEFTKYLADNNIKTFAQYQSHRDSLPSALKSRLPFNPKDVYSVHKGE